MSDVPSLLPPNATASERAIEQAIARAADVPLPQRSLWDPDTCPVALLPWLAWTYSVDLWDPAWTDEVKRQVIRESTEVHRRKGTVGAIRRAIEALGYGIEFTEWWQTTGLDVHEFSVLVQTYGLGITPEVQRVIIAIIDNTKPLRSHMADISVTALVPPAEAYVGAVPFDGAYSYHVAEVGALPLPGIPDGSLALVGESAPFAIYQYEEATEEWYALLVYVEAFGDLPLPIDTREGCLALVGDAVDLDEREVYIFIAGAWSLAGDPRVIARALLADLPDAADVKTGTVAFVGAAPPEQEIHSSTGSAWLAHLVYRAATGDLPASAREGAMALVGTGSPLRLRDGYLYEGAAWHRLGMAAPRTLSSLFDIQSTDLDGAVARYGNQLVRLLRSLTNPFGAAIDIWLPIEVYAATTRTVVGRLVGTEAAAAGSTIGGFTFVSNGVGNVPDLAQAVISQAADYIQLFSTGSAGVTAYARCNFSVGATTKFYLQTEIAWDLTGTGVCVVRAGEGNALPQEYFSARTSGLAAAQFANAGNSATLGGADALRGGGQLLKTPTSGLYSTLELLDEGRTEITTAIVDGLDYAMMQRDAVNGGTIGNGAGSAVSEVGLTFQTRTTFSAGTATARIKRCTLLTYT